MFWFAFFCGVAAFCGVLILFVFLFSDSDHKQDRAHAKALEQALLKKQELDRLVGQKADDDGLNSGSSEPPPKIKNYGRSSVPPPTG